MKLAEFVKQNNDDLFAIAEIQYSVIYSIDGEQFNEFDRPPRPRRVRNRERVWNRTEKCASDCGIEGFKHEKWCACLTQAEFNEFVDHVGIYADDVETMGSLGAPTPDGVYLGVLPAICFSCDDYFAYVTPFVMNSDLLRPMDENDWQSLRAAIIEKYS